ncbi:hypothetical protein [Hafnia phage Pocis76]|uniref:DUF7244 domain-containing protein n=1 Tax=Hafnia phage Pocis76 TaxID=2831174 RepID=A0A8E7KXR9_9CAUD|nr:hypothetical protein [Hafnia phage Pocis76]
MKVVCARNTSTVLPFTEGHTYDAVYLHGGLYEISGDNGRAIIAPLEGHYLTFSKSD